MTKTIRNWLTIKWRLVSNSGDVVNAYGAVFASPPGQVVLQHLVDNIYCTVYEGVNPDECVVHNARRSVVHEILVNIDLAQNPGKYRVRELLETQSINGDS